LAPGLAQQGTGTRPTRAKPEQSNKIREVFQKKKDMGGGRWSQPAMVSVKRACRTAGSTLPHPCPRRLQSEDSSRGRLAGLGSALTSKWLLLFSVNRKVAALRSSTWACTLARTDCCRIDHTLQLCGGCQSARNDDR
jgi:hypothetical protein